MNTVFNSAEMRAMRSPKQIPVGAVIEWVEILCRHRGTYRIRKIVVELIEGMNIRDDQGDYYYWTDLKKNTNVTCSSRPVNNG